VYFWVGFASGVFCILTLPLNLAGFDLGTYSESHRMRGFYNEGGPYGLYVLSVFLVGIALYRLGWEKKGKLRFAFAVLSIAFIGSQSKAAFVAILVMFLLNGFLSQSIGRRLAFVLGAVVFLFFITRVVDLAEGVRIYQQAGEAYERASHLHADDPNFVYGRIAGAFLVPRMIEAHPLTGVGWGNYGIVRNAPEYRGASSWADINDEPGLGLFGTTAELGLPLTLYLIGCLFLPYIYLRRKKAPLFLTNLVLLQPVVHIFGAQLNLTYPWILTSFALGITYSTAKASKASSEGSALITMPSN
jgi:O-antigen ligase